MMMEKYLLHFIDFQGYQLIIHFFEKERTKKEVFDFKNSHHSYKKLNLLKLKDSFAFYETENTIYYVTANKEGGDMGFETRGKRMISYLVSQHLVYFYFQYFQIYYRKFHQAYEIEKNFSIQCIQSLIETAVLEKVSDIHLEIFEEYSQIRFRVDGKLTRIAMISSESHTTMISQIKILSKLNIVEKRLPQDGSFSLMIQKRKIDFRVSILPNIYGEKLVIRILDRNNSKFDLENLGFLTGQLNMIRKVLSSSAGIILNCGPTGSGKTTTLYSFLEYKNKEDTNMVTIEDPVEYHLDGITQITCKEEIGLNFSTILKSLLRQDPDIIMIGEIRDSETAELAIKAALTGHLVFSSIHAKDSIQCIDRLCNLGISPFLIANSLLMILSQRLLRKNCFYCKVENDNTKQLLSLIGMNRQEEMKSYHSLGCSCCNYKGYSGRIGIYEIFLANEYNRNWILCRDGRTETKPQLVSLQENALEKVKLGIISLEEMIGVI